jgi:hypothetical protein
VLLFKLHQLGDKFGYADQVQGRLKKVFSRINNNGIGNTFISSKNDKEAAAEYDRLKELSDRTSEIVKEVSAIKEFLQQYTILSRLPADDDLRKNEEIKKAKSEIKGHLKDISKNENNPLRERQAAQLALVEICTIELLAKLNPDKSNQDQIKQSILVLADVAATNEIVDPDEALAPGERIIKIDTLFNRTVEMNKIISVALNRVQTPLESSHPANRRSRRDTILGQVGSSQERSRSRVLSYLTQTQELSNADLPPTASSGAPTPPSLSSVSSSSSSSSSSNSSNARDSTRRDSTHSTASSGTSGGGEGEDLPAAAAAAAAAAAVAAGKKFKK